MSESALVGEAEAVDQDVGQLIGDGGVGGGVGEEIRALSRGEPLEVLEDLGCFDGDAHSKVFGRVVHRPGAGVDKGRHVCLQLPNGGLCVHRSPPLLVWPRLYAFLAQTAKSVFI